MNGEIGLTPVTKRLWENRPKPFELPSSGINTESKPDMGDVDLLQAARERHAVRKG